MVVDMIADCKTQIGIIEKTSMNYVETNRKSTLSGLLFCGLLLHIQPLY